MPLWKETTHKEAPRASEKKIQPMETLQMVVGFLISYLEILNRMGKIMMDQTEIWVPWMSIYNQVLYQQSYLMSVIEPVWL